MTLIVAYDPGRTTGVAYFRDYKTRGAQSVVTDQLEPHHLTLWTDIESLDPNKIVYERFQYQRRPNVDLYPVEVIGILKLYASMHGIPIKEQTPAQAKNLWTDEKLKKLDLWVPAKPHAMDALRHLLYYMVVTKGDRSWIDQLKK